MAKKKKTAKFIAPDPGTEAEYKKRLLKIIKKMFNETEANINNLESYVDKHSDKWDRIFKQAGDDISEWFVNRVDKTVKKKLKRNIEEAADLSVKFKTTEPVRNILDLLVNENVSLIKSIPYEYHEKVNRAVMDSVMKGRDLGGLKKELKKIYGITERRARKIARDQNNKATENIGLQRSLSLGIKEGEWMHRSGSKQPRQPHIKAHGKRFDLEKGLLIDGEYIFPGEKINCNCTFKPVIPTIGEFAA